MSQSGKTPQNTPNQPDKQLNDEPVDCDWRDPSKPRNPEDDVVVNGWRRCADGTYERADD